MSNSGPLTWDVGIFTPRPNPSLEREKNERGLHLSGSENSLVGKELVNGEVPSPWGW